MWLVMLVACLRAATSTLHAKIVFYFGQDGPSETCPIVYKRERKSHDFSMPLYTP